MHAAVQAAFEPEMLDSTNNNRSSGLGSGMSDFAKDCGYKMDTDRPFSLSSHGTVKAYDDCQRSRFINNALIFGAQCWGHIALEGTPSMNAFRSLYS
jgi:hypothetical protein